MKHAIMVIGYGDSAEVLQKTIKILDDENIDFFIHWDKKYKLPSLISKNSQIKFLHNRIAVKWGSGTLIKATVNLLKEVNKSKKRYDYVHLISSNDMPLMTADYFKDYFKKDIYIGFSNERQENNRNRLKYFYPNNIDFRKHPRIIGLITLLNKILKVNRVKKINNIEKGPEWFSIKSKYINEILSYNLSIFYHSNCADELVLPTIFRRFNNSEYKDGLDDSSQAARYIDWNRGNPYTFSIKDVNELKAVKNTKYAFTRKINNELVITRVFDLQ